MEKINVGIIGGAGYTAGELIRILLHHPMVNLAFIQSKSHSGQPIWEAHEDLYGESSLVFSEGIEEADLIFLCTGHGKSNEALEHIENKRIIDLSNDFRLKEKNIWNGNSFVYGLPELNRDSIRNSKYIANPGCFATAIELAFLPLAKEKLIDEELHIHGITGSTGAGQSLSDTTHFSWRNNNVSVYKAFTHQHLDEIQESLSQLQENIPMLNFIPVRGNFTRGIHISGYTTVKKELSEIQGIYRDYYKGHPFVNVSEKTLHLKQVINTNKCMIHLEQHGEKLLITSIIDNLVKGASGQAVQNMNLMFGWEETTGLHLKSIAF